MPDISAILEEVKAKGGAVIFPRMEFPGTVVIGMFTDPTGNQMGLVEIENGSAKTPIHANAVRY